MGQWYLHPLIFLIQKQSHPSHGRLSSVIPSPAHRSPPKLPPSSPSPSCPWQGYHHLSAKWQCWPPNWFPHVHQPHPTPSVWPFEVLKMQVWPCTSHLPLGILRGLSGATELESRCFSISRVHDALSTSQPLRLPDSLLFSFPKQWFSERGTPSRNA